MSRFFWMLLGSASSGERDNLLQLQGCLVFLNPTLLSLAKSSPFQSHCWSECMHFLCECVCGCVALSRGTTFFPAWSKSTSMDPGLPCRPTTFTCSRCLVCAAPFIFKSRCTVKRRQKKSPWTVVVLLILL